MAYDNLENFDRKYEVTIRGAGGGFQFGGEQFPLHISFSMQKSEVSAPNNGNISIWNLSPEHVAMLIEGEENARLTLRAGYRDHLFHIFSGIVSFSSTCMDGADRRTDIEVIDALEEQRDSYTSLTFDPGTNWRDITDAAAAALGVGIDYGPDVEFKSIETGFSFSGLADDILTKACDSNGLSWSVQDGMIKMKKVAMYMKNTVYEISAATGMIEMPVRTCIAGTFETGDKIVGYDVTMLLNGDINVDDQVFLNSKTAKGYFRVHSVDFSGDSMGGDWITKVRLMEIGKG